MMGTSRKIYYGLGALGKDLVYGFVSGYIMFYLNDTMGISAFFLGTLFLFARTFDAVNDPIMGMIVDNTRTRFGKFRPWIAIGTLLNAVIIVLLFSMPDLSASGMKIYAAAFYILWGTTYTLMDIPYWSMIPALSRDQKERETLTVSARVFAGIGSTIVSVGTLPFIHLVSPNSDRLGLKYLGLIIALIFVTLIAVTVIKVKETVPAPKAKIGLKSMFQILSQNDQLMIVMVTIVLFNIATYLTTSLGIYFFKYDIQNELLYSVFAGVAGIGQIFAMLIFPKLSVHFKRRQIFISAGIMSICGYVGLFFMSQLFEHMNTLAYVIMFFSGFIIFMGIGFINVLTTAMLADTVEYGEWKLGLRSESIIFSTQTFVVKLSSALSAFIMGIGLDVIHLIPNQVQTTNTILGLRLLMFLVPIIGLILSLIVFTRHFKITESFYEMMLDQLTVKNQEKE